MNEIQEIKRKIVSLRKSMARAQECTSNFGYVDKRELNLYEGYINAIDDVMGLINHVCAYTSRDFITTGSKNPELIGLNATQLLDAFKNTPEGKELFKSLNAEEFKGAYAAWTLINEIEVSDGND